MKKLNMNAVLGTIALVILLYIAYLYVNSKKIVIKEKMGTTTDPVVCAQNPTLTPMSTGPADKVLTTDELLPKLSSEADDFVKQNPVADMLKEQNFLVSGYHVGINTVLQSHKIPYYDLRSSPAISKQDFEWNNSYIESPVGVSTRRQFEIGGC